ncbi:3-hydroxyacyl-CoA dehydrogenase NAD-binding domain-containing protein [Flammeovirga sp. EKP202]|uniref:3-hydroxyacyl-CoA dehydrogenase NAD-binding domain-containing protein n=1 Tax=Flammeovirga sp. EKP202 TaxID=2770592 RepID=UPI00165EDB11|nr:3-hydroxyacyl-CoA dehydrogenase NAD-binding domain-containing protein [Flammeovirga sp. EKP202]MBD0399891.1 3-hydroxyacyl-CoA dehydrogenase [Flammeovirga sp. EKP202]
MLLKSITIAGADTLGSEISWYIAFNGYRVKLYDTSDIGLEIGKALHEKFAASFLEKFTSNREQVDTTLKNIHYTSDLEEACQECDLFIESIPEKMEAKIEFYKAISQFISPTTIVASNSDSFIPSDLAPHFKHPLQLVGAHFTNVIWENRLVEIMGHPDTDILVIESLIHFIKNLNILPIVLQKENSGYLLNSLLIPMLSTALTMLRKGIASFEDIDKSWMAIGNKYGPFIIIDAVGLDTVYNIEKYWGEKDNDQKRASNAEFLQNEYIKKGKLGMISGEGFYKYPNPLFSRDSFLKI